MRAPAGGKDVCPRGKDMRYRLAVFDMDGTILDTLDDLTDTLNMSLAEVGMPVRTKDEVRSFVGN